MPKLKAAKVQGNTERGRLSNPRDLAKVMCTSTRADKFALLLGQVAVAEKRKNMSWLRILATELDKLQFQSPEWIRQNVSQFNMVRRPPPNHVSTSDSLRVASNQFIEQCEDDLKPDFLSDTSCQSSLKESSLHSGDQLIDFGTSGTIITQGKTLDLENVTVSQGEESGVQNFPVIRSANASCSSADVEGTITCNSESCSNVSSVIRKRIADFSESSNVAAKKFRQFELKAVSSCPVSSCKRGASLKHALLCHLPYVFNPNLTGDEISERRLNALRLVTKWLLGEQQDLSHLIKMLESLNPQRLEEEVNPVYIIVMRDFLRSLGKSSVPEVFTLKPRNNGVEVLVHWRFLLHTVSVLDDEKQKNFRNLYVLPEGGESSQIYPDGFDSYCYLDNTLKKLKMQFSDVALDVLEEQSPLDSHVVKLVGAVGVFSDPDNYPTLGRIQAWVRQGVIPIVGYHPQIAFSESNLEKLKKVLAFKEVVGLGNIGIDRRDDPEKWAGQLLLLNKLLYLLSPKHVLVLQCRSLSKLSDETILTMLYLLMAHPTVKSQQLIHFHNFTGSPAILKMWLEKFPNTYFGFAAVKCDSVQYLETIRQVELSRVLLETDSPFFNPRRCKVSTPHMIGWVAARIAAVRNMTWTELLQMSNENSRRLYIEKIPPKSTMQD